MPELIRPRLLNYTPSRPFCAIPGYYHPISTPPPCPGWYFCQLDTGLAHLYWPGDGQWAEVSHWVELPTFVQGMLGQP